ncbi:MAG: hypothetical protein ACHQZQ_06965 [SAR324 cluster bacterium]
MTAASAGFGPGSGGLGARIEAIEAAYEFTLGYAAQGLSGAGAGAPGSAIREQLDSASRALDGLAGALEAAVQARNLQPAPDYRAFIAVLGEDAARSNAALRLLLGLPAITSQAIDNLNALIHLRALLTDLFFIDEILKETGPL